jgi:hypothetical protein
MFADGYYPTSENAKTTSVLPPKADFIHFLVIVIFGTSLIGHIQQYPGVP